MYCINVTFSHWNEMEDVVFNKNKIKGVNYFPFMFGFFFFVKITFCCFFIKLFSNFNNLYICDNKVSFVLGPILFFISYFLSSLFLWNSSPKSQLLFFRFRPNQNLLWYDISFPPLKPPVALPLQFFSLHFYLRTHKVNAPNLNLVR